MVKGSSDSGDAICMRGADCLTKRIDIAEQFRNLSLELPSAFIKARTRSSFFAICCGSGRSNDTTNRSSKRVRMHDLTWSKVLPRLVKEQAQNKFVIKPSAAMLDVRAVNMHQAVREKESAAWPVAETFCMVTSDLHI